MKELYCILLKFSKYGDFINKFFNIISPIAGMKPCERGSLQTRCVQTADVMNKLLNAEYPLNIDLVHQTPQQIYMSLLTQINFCNEDEIINLSLSFGNPYLNGFNCSTQFPGHASNIILYRKNGANHIFIVQSFIYTYKTKVFYSDNSDFLRVYISYIKQLFNGNPIFTPADVDLYKKVFASNMNDYQGNSLIGKPKPDISNVKMINSKSNLERLKHSIRQCIFMSQSYRDNNYHSFTDSKINEMFANISCKPATTELKIKSIIKFFEKIVDIWTISLEDCDIGLILRGQNMNTILQDTRQLKPFKKLGINYRKRGNIYNILKEGQRKSVKSIKLNSRQKSLKNSRQKLLKNLRQKLSQKRNTSIKIQSDILRHQQQVKLNIDLKDILEKNPRLKAELKKLYVSKQPASVVAMTLREKTIDIFRKYGFNFPEKYLNKIVDILNSSYNWSQQVRPQTQIQDITEMLSRLRFNNQRGGGSSSS